MLLLLLLLLVVVVVVVVCVCVCVCVCGFRFWERTNNGLAYSWGTLGWVGREAINPDFQGFREISPVRLAGILCGAGLA